MLTFADVQPYIQARQVEYKTSRYLADEIHGKAVVGFIIQGCVSVYAVALDGHEVCLNHLYPGDCFGIANLARPGAVNTILRCEPNSQIQYVSKDDLFKLLQERADLAMKYAMLCNDKIQFLLQRIESLTMKSSRGKIIADILVHHENLRMQLIGSREDWASRLAMSRATLFRELAQLQKDGYIQMKGKELFILDLKQLQKEEGQL